MCGTLLLDADHILTHALLAYGVKTEKASGNG
jgi:hypothetical protein